MLWACVECTTRFAPGLAACPHCGGRTFQEAPGGVVEAGAPVLTIPGPLDETAMAAAETAADPAPADAAAVSKAKAKAPKAEGAPAADAAPASAAESPAAG